MAIIDRSGAESLINEELSREIIQGVSESSAVMQLGTRAPNMSTKQRKVPVLSQLPTAYFVDGDTGQKQTTTQAWDKKYFIAEELAVIVPIPEAVLDDSDYDIWGQVQPRIQEAMGLAFDQAVLYGTNAPTEWPTDLLAGATAASNTVALGTGADLYDDILGESGVISLVEEDGFMANGHVASMNMRGKLRGLRDNDGQPLFKSTMQESTRYQLDGEQIIFPRNGAIDPAQSLLFSGDFSQLVYSMRQDITFKLLDQAVIQNPDGSILYNLAQQDMVALRAVMRIAWQIPNPINRLNADEATRYPFAVLTPATGV